MFACQSIICSFSPYFQALWILWTLNIYIYTGKFGRKEDWRNSSHLLGMFWHFAQLIYVWKNIYPEFPNTSWQVVPSVQIQFENWDQAEQLSGLRNLSRPFIFSESNLAWDAVDRAISWSENWSELYHIEQLECFLQNTCHKSLINSSSARRSWELMIAGGLSANNIDSVWGKQCRWRTIWE